MRLLKRLSPAMRAIIIAVVVLAVHAIFIVTDGLRDEIAPSDLIVVFGNKVERSGEPSPRLRARLERTLQLYNDGLAPAILVSGGLGKEGHDEAVVMRDWLVDRNVPRDKIVVDSEGWDSGWTAAATSKTLKNLGGSRALIVTQYWHISRAKLALHRAGVPTVHSARAHYFGLRDIYSILREIPAYYKYLVI